MFIPMGPGGRDDVAAGRVGTNRKTSDSGGLTATSAVAALPVRAIPCRPGGGDLTVQHRLRLLPHWQGVRLLDQQLDPLPRAAPAENTQ